MLLQHGPHVIRSLYIGTTPKGMEEVSTKNSPLVTVAWGVLSLGCLTTGSWLLPAASLYTYVTTCFFFLSVICLGSHHLCLGRVCNRLGGDEDGNKQG